MTAHISVPYSKQGGEVVRGVLIPPADGHQHFVEVSDALAKGESRGLNYGRTGVNGGHSHAWHETPTGIAFEPADGHTHPPIVMAELVGKQTGPEAKEERGSVDDQLQGIAQNLRREIDDLMEADVEDDDFPERLVDIQRLDEMAQSLADQLGLERVDPNAVSEAEALVESISTKRDNTMKEATAMDFQKDARDAAVLLDEVVEKARGEAETYVAATQRLAYEASPEGQQYRKLASMADRSSRAASTLASATPGVGDHFRVVEKLENGMARVEVRKSEAELEIEKLARDIQSKEGGDYYDAYAKATGQRPDLYAIAVG